MMQRTTQNYKIQQIQILFDPRRHQKRAARLAHLADEQWCAGLTNINWIRANPRGFARLRAEMREVLDHEEFQEFLDCTERALAESDRRRASLRRAAAPVLKIVRIVVPPAPSRRALTRTTSTGRRTRCARRSTTAASPSGGDPDPDPARAVEPLQNHAGQPLDYYKDLFRKLIPLIKRLRPNSQSDISRYLSGDDGLGLVTILALENPRATLDELAKVVVSQIKDENRSRCPSDTTLGKRAKAVPLDPAWIENLGPVSEIDDLDEQLPPQLVDKSPREALAAQAEAESRSFDSTEEWSKIADSTIRHIAAITPHITKTGEALIRAAAEIFSERADDPYFSGNDKVFWRAVAARAGVKAPTAYTCRDKLRKRTVGALMVVRRDKPTVVVAPVATPTPPAPAPALVIINPSIITAPPVARRLVPSAVTYDPISRRSSPTSGSSRAQARASPRRRYRRPQTRHPPYGCESEHEQLNGRLVMAERYPA